MAGAPPGYMPVPQGYQPQPQYQQPLYPQQPQQYPPPAPAPVPGEDFADTLMKQYQGIKKVAKMITRDEAKQQQQQYQAGQYPNASDPGQPDNGQQGRAYDDWKLGLEVLSDEQLEAEMAKYPPGSRHNRALIEEYDARGAQDEFGENEEEIAAMLVRNVYVDDGSTGWIPVSPNMSVENLQDLTDQVKAAHPYARKMKYGRVERDGRTVKNRAGSCIVSIRSDDDVRANVAKDVGSGKLDAAKLAALPAPPPPAGLDAQNQILFKGVTDTMQTLIASVVAKPREDEAKKMLDTMMLAKQMFMDPMIEMMKANKPSASDPRLGLEMAQAVIAGATAMSKANQGGPNSTMDTLLQVADRVGPMLFKQQQQAQPALPAPADKLPGPDPGAAMQQKIRTVVGRALGYLASGRFTAAQLPHFAFQNLSQAGISMILGMGPQGFGTMVREVAIAQGLPQAYMQRQDVQLGFVWVYEEIARTALIANWLETQGKPAERARLIDWATPPIVPWREAQPIVGDEAHAIFQADWPDVAQPTDDMNLPPAAQTSMHEPPKPGAPTAQGRGGPPQAGPLRVVRDDEPVIVDPFGAPAPARQQAPVQAPVPSEPDFA